MDKIDEVNETLTKVVFFVKCHSPLPPLPIHLRFLSFGIRLTNLRRSFESGMAGSASLYFSAKIGGSSTAPVSCFGLVGALPMLYLGRLVKTIASMSDADAKVGCIIVIWSQGWLRHETHQFDKSEGDPYLQPCKTSTSLDQSIQFIRSHLPPIQTKVPHLDHPFPLHDSFQQGWRNSLWVVTLLDLWNAGVHGRVRQES